MESHEPISARKQKRYSFEPLPGLASGLDIGLSELPDTKHLNDVPLQLDSSVDGDASTIALSDPRNDSGSLDAVSMNGLEPRHLEQVSPDVRGLARKSPLSLVLELGNT